MKHIKLGDLDVSRIGLGTMTMSGVYLSPGGDPGRHRVDPGDPPSQDDALAINRTITDKVREIAERIGATPAQVALAWVPAQGEYVVPIPGTKTPKYLQDNAGAADVRLSAEDLAGLDALPTPEGGRYY